MGAEVRILYFGAAQEAAGKSGESLKADDTSTLRKAIIEKYPAMAGIPFRMALNKTMLKGEAALENDDTVAILPPFQGG